MTLLHLLSRLREEIPFTLSAIHVNHQLSRNAQAWENFCVELCAHLAVPLEICKVRVPRRAGLGLEGAARAARYQAFSQADFDILVLAHHLDDQAETLMQNLLRGSGLAGAAAMPELRAMHEVAGKRLWRPMLAVPRTTLQSYARRHHLHWVDDESNANTVYTRNFLRHEVLPTIEQRFPAYRETLARAAENFAEADNLLSDLATLDLQQIVRHEKLQLKALAQLSLTRAMNALRGYLAQQGIPSLDRGRLQECLQQLLNARGDRQVALEIKHLCLRRYRGEVWLEALNVSTPENWSQAWNGEPHLLLPELHARLDFTPTVGGGISLQKLQQGNVVLRLRQGGEKLRLHARQPRRLLKHLFQEAGIPAWQRMVRPLLYCDQQLVAVPGIGIDFAFQAEARETGLELLWHPLNLSATQ